MVAVAEQCPPPHVERHAVRRQVTGAMHNWCASQQDPDLQPVRGWNKPWHRMVDSSHVEQPGDIDSHGGIERAPRVVTRPPFTPWKPLLIAKRESRLL